jgi:dissimilatory sulfite reductase (desulfoviridin) alpha/beta subunit
MGKIMYGVRYYGARPVLNTDNKDVLQKLADLCPVNAIKVDGEPRIRRCCVRCMSCVESCEDNAVTLKVPKILHRTFRSKALGYDLSKMK